MKKNFFKFSLCLNVVFAILAVIFTIIFYVMSAKIDEGEALLDVLQYAKTFFDLLAVFTGYTTIIYAFNKFGFYNGLIAIGVFSISFLISFVFQVVGSCIDNSAAFTTDFLIYVIYYAFGNGFISQMIPALLLAYISHKASKKGNKTIKQFISWQNPVQRSMLIITLIIFGLNVVAHTGFVVLPTIISEFSEYGSITYDFFTEIIVSYVVLIIFYLIMQYIVYFLVYGIFDNYCLSHPDKPSKDILVPAIDSEI